MIAFLFILLAALVLIFINISSTAKGKTGKIIGAAVLFLIFIGMFFRDTFLGSCLVTFFAVWIPNALILYIPWTLYRIGYYLTQPHHLSRHKVRRVGRWLAGITAGVTFAFMAYGIPHNDEYKTNLLTIDLPSQYPSASSYSHPQTSQTYFIIDSSFYFLGRAPNVFCFRPIRPPRRAVRYRRQRLPPNLWDRRFPRSSNRRDRYRRGKG